MTRDLNSRVLTVSGHVPAGHAPVSQGCSVPYPSLFIAHELTRRLREVGVRVGGSPRVAPCDVKCLEVVATHNSASLGHIIRFMNKRSDNHTAKQLLRVCAILATGDLDPENDRQCLKSFLADCQIPEDETRPTDGSGLSRLNLLTPRAIV